MDSFNGSELESSIDRFYAAAARPQLWPVALESLAHATGAAGIILMDRRRSSGFGYACTDSVREHMDLFVRQNWLQRNYRFERGLDLVRRNGIITESMLCETAELDREPLQAEFLRQFGLRWFAGVSVVNEPEADILLSVERYARSEPFSRDEVSVLHRALPHIRRAGQLALALSASVTSGMLWGLDQCNRAAVALAGNGKVLQVNERAERLLGDGVAVTQSRLVATFRGADPAFQKLLGSAFVGLEGKTCEPVALPRQRKRPLVAHVAPIVKSATDLFPRAKALVTFVEPEPGEPPSAALLQDVFGLTPAQARIALALARGDELRRAADQNGIAFETARVHLREIFAKTRTHRQVELALLINRLGI